jgi:hypothetical protein
MNTRLEIGFVVFGYCAGFGSIDRPSPGHRRGGRNASSRASRPERARLLSKAHWLLRCRPLADGPRLGSLLEIHRLSHPSCDWVLPQSCSRCPGRLRGHLIACIAYGERRSRSWQQSSLRSGLSALLLRSQVAAGYLFPGTGWVGLAAVALLPGIFLSTQVLSFRRRCVALSFVIGFCIGIRIDGRFFPPNRCRASSRMDCGQYSFRRCLPAFPGLPSGAVHPAKSGRVFGARPHLSGGCCPPVVRSNRGVLAPIA